MSEENIQPQPIEPAPTAVTPVEAPAPIEPIAVAQPEPVVVAPEPVVQVNPEPIAEPVVEPKPMPAGEPKLPKVKASTRNAVVSNAEKDEVFLANCVYKNTFSRKSLTVHHLQRRLTELGYVEANADKDGWLGDLTKSAITKFQKDRGLNATGTVDADTFKKIFEGDNNVNVNL